jgi:hypothetical protein
MLDTLAGPHTSSAVLAVSLSGITRPVPTLRAAPMADSDFRRPFGAPVCGLAVMLESHLLWAASPRVL